VGQESGQIHVYTAVVLWDTLSLTFIASTCIRRPRPEDYVKEAEDKDFGPEICSSGSSSLKNFRRLLRRPFIDPSSCTLCEIHGMKFLRHFIPTGIPKTPNHSIKRYELRACSLSAKTSSTNSCRALPPPLCSPMVLTPEAPTYSLLVILRGGSVAYKVPGCDLLLLLFAGN
jgi:hypothetical protein